MRPTRRGIAVFAAAVVLVAFGQWGGFAFARTLGIVLLAVVLAAAAMIARKPRVLVRRSVYPDRVERGQPALGRLRVRNPGDSRHGGMLATDAAGGETHTVRVRSLAAGAEATYHYELPTGTRGRLTVGPLTLLRADPLGLAENRLPTGETATLRVHPRQWNAHALAGGRPRHYHAGNTDDRLRGSAEMQDVREYIPGDEIRHLHWKATARTGKLMVRDMIDPEQPRFTLLLDVRPGALDAAEFEQAVDTAASLLGAAARTGQHSRLVTSAGADLPTPGGTNAVRSLLDELCELTQRGVAGDPLVPQVLAAGSEAGGCLAVLTSGGAELGSLGWLRQRFATVYVLALSAAGVAPRVPGTTVLGARTAEQAVQRWNEAIR